MFIVIMFKIRTVEFFCGYAERKLTACAKGFHSRSAAIFRRLSYFAKKGRDLFVKDCFAK